MVRDTPRETKKRNNLNKKLGLKKTAAEKRLSNLISSKDFFFIPQACFSLSVVIFQIFYSWGMIALKQMTLRWNEIYAAFFAAQRVSGLLTPVLTRNLCISQERKGS